MKMKNLIKPGIVLFSLLFLTALFFSFKKGDDFKISKNLDIYYTLFREVNMFYVDEVDPEKMVKESIDAMLESLDPYNKFYPESEVDELKFMTTGNYGGIGALIQKKGDYAIISQPYKGFPADKAGLRAGDKIKQINNKSVKGWSLNKISDELKGIPNTNAKIVIERPGIKDTLVKNVAREKIHINSVPFYEFVGKNDDIAYIRLSKFTQNCAREVRNAYQSLSKEKEPAGVVLDLRSNPGGLLDEAVNVANLFVPKNQEIVSTKGRIKERNQTYYTENQPLDTNVRLAVLINRASASASEIVSGSIQDLDRGVILGQRTFGKGLVQITKPLSYNTKLKLTAAKYYIPSGRCIQAKDYSNRNEDGSVGEIPDTLIKEFTTRNGRKVYDGGGIRPDIEVKPKSLSKIEISLLSKNLIFDYATHFRLKNDSIAPVEQFKISETTFTDFKNFLEEKNWDYTTETEKQLEKLINKAKDEKYYERAREEIKHLEKKVSHNKEKDIKEFSSSIKKLLKDEIVSRYYYQAGAIQAGLEENDQLNKALEILEDQKQYKNIIRGEFKRNNVQKMEDKLSD